MAISDRQTDAVPVTLCPLLLPVLPLADIVAKRASAHLPNEGDRNCLFIFTHGRGGAFHDHVFTK